MKLKEIDKSKLTNVMKQYYDIKENYIQEVVLFQLGDFYEMFFEDAIRVSKDLELTLTGKKAGLTDKIPMCGIPLSTLKDYVPKLLSYGYTIVIVEQVETSELGKTLVKREVTKIVSKGTYLSETNDNNFIGCLYKDNEYQLSYGDVATGELYSLKSDNLKEVQNEIINQSINELLVIEDNLDHDILIELKVNEVSLRIVKDFIQNDNIDVNIIISMKSEEYLLKYLNLTQVKKIDHFKQYKNVESKNMMFLSYNTQKQLELLNTLENGEYKYSLFWYLNNTVTAMGKRLLKNYIIHPLMDETLIKSRQKIIEEFINNPILLEEVISLLKEIYDFERLIGKVINNSITPKEVEKLKISLGIIPNLFNVLNIKISSNIELDKHDLPKIIKLHDYLESIIIDDAPIILKDGNFIKDGFSKEIDELRNIKKNSNNWLAEFEKKQREITGISNLKVKYNKIFGYFIEVTNSNIGLVPDYYIRKQTMANCERYITEELKEEENKILNAHDILLNLEYKIYNEVKEEIKKEIDDLQSFAKSVAKIDVFSGLAIIAINNNLVKPNFNDKNLIDIKEGKHPIVKKLSKEYIDNDLTMDEKNIVTIITGPNMAGKSTYMRMLALIVIMGQIGSYVPAKYVNIPIFDGLFTRIGASDNLSKGKSTFMIEMNETNEALQNATKNSLIIFDELGRGTSTYDGVALATAIIEYLASTVEAKTLFSTHYHELSDLDKTNNKINLVHVKADEINGEVKFYHKVLPGSTDKSYGIEVAKLAGIDNSIINNAKSLYQKLDNKKVSLNKERSLENHFVDNNYKQDNTVSKYDELLKIINDVDINNLTPMECLNLLNEIKEKYENTKK